ncbi:MAG: Rne/Rng family ribonuclease, partial [Nocardioides sp.]
TALSGSPRLEANKQRRREGRVAGRRRAPIVSEAEFLARREAVDRVMVIRQRKDLTQIAVLEDKVLVEHYVARESQTSLIGNVYLGRVQNVLPSMEAAFIDIGKGRNAVLYAGEVNWDTLGAGNGPRKIEAVLKSGQSVLVQVTKDPIGHKGARLTSQISLPGRFLVYVPDGTTSGISRKLPDTERSRLKSLLKEIVPDSAGVIVRTAAEGASEEELTRDVERLTARWADIESKVEKGNAPQLLYGEPDLTLKVVRDLFTEDFGKLVVSGDDAWEMVQDYVDHVAPDLAERLEKHDASEDVFATFRIDEQIDKALDRKVWLPSGGSLIIDRTEAMTVVDVNTGKFTGSGGNLEETVTKNNLEAAEEIIRQLRLRDIGGIIVVDFIDMVLESNRDLVLRRMVECLGRDRTRHQVAEVTSLGLVQMTRKRIGTGLLEAFTENCEHCQGRGLITHHEPVEARKKQDEEPRRGRGRRGRGRDEQDGDQGSTAPSPKDVAAMARHEQAERADEAEQEPTPAEQAGATEAAPEERPEREPGEREGGRRRNRRRERPETDHGEEPAVEVTTPEPEVTTPEPEAAQQPVESPVQTPAPAAAPEGDGVVQQPLVRSSSRARGRASRPAGSPNRAAEEAAVMTVAPTAPTDGTQPEAPAAEPVAVETAAPRVVTSTRRRVASRPAGPPAAATSAAPPATDPEDGQPSLLDAAGEAGTGEHDGPDAGPVHVPVKKKGSRKR